MPAWLWLGLSLTGVLPTLVGAASLPVLLRNGHE